MNQTKFDLGEVVATPACLAAVQQAEQTVDEFLVRHQSGDWGQVSLADASLNDIAMRDGARLFSSYVLKSGIKIWVITEAVGDDGKRASTCLLLPEEY